MFSIDPKGSRNLKLKFVLEKLFCVRLSVVLLWWRFFYSYLKMFLVLLFLQKLNVLDESCSGWSFFLFFFRAASARIVFQCALENFINDFLSWTHNSDGRSYTGKSKFCQDQIMCSWFWCVYHHPLFHLAWLTLSLIVTDMVT